MPTASTRSANISAQFFATATIGALLERIRNADEISLDLKVSFRADLLKTLLFAAALSRRPRRLNIYFDAHGPSDGVRESLAQTLLGPVLGHVSDTQEAVSSRIVGFDPGGYVDPERRLFCVSTSLLDCESRERFFQDLSDRMRSARIVIAEPVLMRIAALAFEPAQNAEEHGSTRLDDPSPVFRYLIARVYDQPGPELPSSARTYIERYSASGHTERTRWLEIIIVDAGMGLSYPRFYVRARALNSSTTDVYAADFEAERWAFSEALDRGQSTKGYWGVSRSSQTTTGQGHRLILRNVLAMRGYASVHAGRCFGSVHSQSADRDRPDSVGYAVSQVEQEMFAGTAWHLLVPLDQQLKLAL